MENNRSKSTQLRNSFIDLAALGGDIAIDCTIKSQPYNIVSKVGIHLASGELKKILDAIDVQNETKATYQYETKTTYQYEDFLKNAAQACGLKLLIQYGTLPIYFIQGGNESKFCEMTGISQNSKALTNEQKSQAISEIMRCGRIIYKAD